MISNVYQSINHIFIEGDNNKEMWEEAKELEEYYEIIEIIFRWRQQQPRLKIYAPKSITNATMDRTLLHAVGQVRRKSPSCCKNLS